MWKKIYSFLKNKGIEVYAPAQHTGECKTKYVVVKDAGVQNFDNFSTSAITYKVMCYVPKEQFSQLGSYVNTIKSYLKELEYTSMIRQTGIETSSFYDEENKSHMVSIQYVAYKQKSNEF